MADLEKLNNSIDEAEKNVIEQVKSPDAVKHVETWKKQMAQKKEEFLERFIQLFGELSKVPDASEEELRTFRHPDFRIFAENLLTEKLLDPYKSIKGKKDDEKEFKQDTKEPKPLSEALEPIKVMSGLRS